MKKNRRTFLKSSMAGVAAAALTSCSDMKQKGAQSASGRESATESQQKEQKYTVVKRTLGRTGIEIPIISMGACAEDRAVYESALDAGLTHIDTDYQHLRGGHEKMVGKIVRERPRDSVVVVTKVNVPTDPWTGLFRKGTKGDVVLKLFEKSMRRLKVDYLDVLYLHSASRAENIIHGSILEALLKLKEEGRTKFLGVSLHGYEPPIIRAVADCGYYDVIMTSYNFKQGHAEEIKKAIAYAAEAGVGIVAMKTQAGAFLDRERTIPINHKAAIKWVLADTNVHTAIPGFNNFQEMEMFLSVMGDLTLTPEEEADLDSARLQAGLYCQQCGRCVPQCPHGVSVPAYMRAFMYAYGYKKPGKAKETIAEVFPKHLPCKDCASCQITCSMGFDVKNRLLDVARLRSIPDDFLYA
jgi:predicted aldo/keto reductase-like oxidoreductase